jgi:hypothetical protein
MFHANSPLAADAYAPADADTLLDDEFCDPGQDDYLDRCLFELRSSISDFRNL